MTPQQKLDQVYRLTKRIPIVNEDAYDVIMQIQEIYLEDVNNDNKANTEPKSTGGQNGS